MATLVKTTQDGRKVEVVGRAITLGGRLETDEVVPVKDIPNRKAILAVAPDAVYMAGRIALTEAEGKIALEALAKAEEQFLTNPKAIEERFRYAARAREAELGIE
jgi:hypothetical protein